MNSKPQFAHQIVDTKSVIERPAYGLWLEPRLGKTRICVDAACELYRRGEIDTIVAVAPANCRSVWADPDPVLGEVAKWAADDVPYSIGEYHANMTFKEQANKLNIVVTNPEYIRRREHLIPLLRWANTRRTFLIGDESWQFQNPGAKQTEAMIALRACSKRVALLNGTPGKPDNLYSQFEILDPSILECKNWYQFRGRYCVLGGWGQKKIVDYQRMEEFERRTAPHAIFRKTRECLDLGEEPVRTQIEVPLTPGTWRVYTELRDELITWLGEHDYAAAPQAGVKVLRLAQVANGFLGGVVGPDGAAPPGTVREIGREKIDGLVEWLRQDWGEDKLVVFTRFRPDVERTVSILGQEWPTHEAVAFYGDQTDTERAHAKKLLAPEGDPRPAIGVVNAQSGGAGLNFAAANIVAFLGNDFSLRLRRQAEGRVEGIDQKRRITILDVLATGPKGQRTIDHVIAAALRDSEDVAAWTAAIWKRKLEAA